MPSEASLIITNSGISNAIPEPGFLQFGQLVLNWADSSLYFKNKENQVNSISIRGVEPIILNERLPVNEGPWTTFSFVDNPPNTDFIPVQREEGDLPRIKIGLISSPEVNFVEIENDTDIIVGVLEGTTMNEVIALIQNNIEANDLIRIFNESASDGTGDITADLPILASAVFANVNEKEGDRAEILGQSLFVNHSAVAVGSTSISEWVAAAINPTKWIPRTPGIIWNRDNENWEISYIDTSAFETAVLPDQL
jgi:hypothetical protein